MTITLPDEGNRFMSLQALTGTRRMFGNRDEVAPVSHLIGTAAAWGGNPEKDAVYLPITPTKSDSNKVHKLRVKDVPVDGFRSITVCNADGYLQAIRTMRTH